MAMRQQEIERNGMAMKQAADLEKQKLEEEMAKKMKALHDQKSAKSRGAAALTKERKLMEEKKDLEEQIKQIERKKQVF